METILIHIKTKAPNAYKEFEGFVKERYQSFFDFHRLSLQIMPRALCIGLFLSYFNEQHIDFSVGDTDETILFDEIIAAFEEYEKVIGHFS